MWSTVTRYQKGGGSLTTVILGSLGDCGSLVYTGAHLLHVNWITCNCPPSVGLGGWARCNNLQYLAHASCIGSIHLHQPKTAHERHGPASAAASFQQPRECYSRWPTWQQRSEPRFAVKFVWYVVYLAIYLSPSITINSIINTMGLRLKQNSYCIFKKKRTNCHFNSYNCDSSMDDNGFGVPGVPMGTASSDIAFSASPELPWALHRV